MSPPKESPPKDPPPKKKKMLILKGNSDTSGKQYPDEQGKMIPWPNGALHEKAAVAYATCRDRVGDVLPVSGDSLKGNRNKNPQTLQALAKLQDPDHPDDYDAIYGFSGGGYDVLHILNHLTAEQLKNIKLVVVLGAPPVDKKGKPTPDGSGSPQKDAFLPEKFGLPKKAWELVYHINKDAGQFPTPNDVDKHMFLPEFLLQKEKCTQKSP